MLIVALTGSIGMGKSTATAMLRQLGVPVYDADAAVHSLTVKHGPALPHIAEAFPGVVSGGVLDRQKLGAQVFGNQPALKRLEAILHPMVHKKQRRFLTLAKRKRAPIVVLDIPLLFEGNGHQRVDATIVVSAPHWLQRRRVLSRPGMTEEKLAGILKQQTPDRIKRRLATYVVPTGLGKAETRRHLVRILEDLRHKDGAHWPGNPFRHRLSLQRKGKRLSK
ncbi:MAG: dephospho-CoA kinase [Alphaproteobacteria bacterium]|nr:dephospho-CoA kinase [Alphaproteobacteria bacterium]